MYGNIKDVENAIKCYQDGDQIQLAIHKSTPLNKTARYTHALVCVSIITLVCWASRESKSGQFGTPIFHIELPMGVA